ncbi:MAG TPA: nuclear transport factor 2 family protein [Dongiaceae bacterium]|nr:nuclear transport factor 2 family protein [Dongiaceae bacterium]
MFKKLARFTFRRWASMIVVPAGLILGAACPSTAQALTPEEEAMHQELRALKDRLTDALNRDDIDAALQETTANVVFTAMNNEVAHGQGELKAYFARMMTGDSKIVDSLKVSFEPDQLSIIYGGNNAIAIGSSKAHFKLTHGLEFDVDGRWTADLIKESDKWKLSAMHYSVNMFDNPLLDNAKRLAWMVGGGTALVGLGLGFFLGRRRRA